MWIEIKHLKDYIKDRGMFVVKAFDVQTISNFDYRYNSDPYCVWYEEDAIDGPFVRWPHPYPPTHFTVLPANHEK